MFRILCKLILCAGIVVSVSAQTGNPFVQGFSWNLSPSTNVPVYVLYHTTNGAALWFQGTNGPSTESWNRIAVTNFSWVNLNVVVTNSYLKTNFVAGVTNWVTVTARDTSGVESEPSNVIYFVPPKPAGTLRLIMQTAPTVNGPWTTPTNVPPVDLPMDQNVQFTRLLTLRL